MGCSYGRSVGGSALGSIQRVEEFRVVYTRAGSKLLYMEAVWSTTASLLASPFFLCRKGVEITLASESLFRSLPRITWFWRVLAPRRALVSNSTRGSSPEIILARDLTWALTPPVSLAGLRGCCEGRRRDCCSGSRPPPTLALLSPDSVYL